MRRLGNNYAKGLLTLQQEGAQVHLAPVEYTLYRLFQNHPEGIRADNLLRHWKELGEIYAQVTPYDEQELRDDKMESLCAESKTVFYANISRIKRKLIAAIGPAKAKKYIIRRGTDGLYRIAHLRGTLNPSVCYDTLTVESP